MALPQTIKVLKSCNQKRERKYDDGHNFHVIVAPGAVAYFQSKHHINRLILVLALAQLCGLFPFVGVFSRNIKDVHFKRYSFRAIHAALWLVSAVIIAYLSVVRLSKEGTLNAKNIS